MAKKGNHHAGINELITEALAIEATDAKEAGTLGYMARALVQATLPHARQLDKEGNEKSHFARKNGNFSMYMLASPDIGLPFGVIPRLLISWLTTEAVRTKSRELAVGSSLTCFMKGLNMRPTGGASGTIVRLRGQMRRLFGAHISCSYTSDAVDSIRNIQLIEESNLWWSPRAHEQLNGPKSSIVLNKGFFDEITQNPVPIDMRALNSLKRSPMAIDLYCWLTYRMYGLRRSTLIPWSSLQLQFGADYKRQTDFRIAFIEHMKKILVLYPEARVWHDESGLILRPSPLHVKRIVSL